MRAMWKGNLHFGRESVAVKLYAAVEDAAVHFHLLHASDHVRVQQRIVNPQTGEVVPAPEIRHGFAVGGGQFVIVNDDELDAIKPKPSRDIEIESALDNAAIPAAYFERPYFLGPDGNAESYYALAAALHEQGKQCLVAFVMRSKRYRAVLRSDGDHLMLVTLRSNDEVLAAPDVKPAESREPSKQELALAEQLVATLHGDFDPSLFRDTYRERVRELVESKAKGKPLKLPKMRARKVAVTSLTDALKQSVAHARPAAQKERKSA